MVIDFGSRSVASLADSMLMPWIRVAPAEGVTMKPAGFASLAKSRFRYLAGVPSIALATPSDPGLFAEDAIIPSLGWRTFLGRRVPSNWTSAICMQQVLGPCVWMTVQR